MKKMKHDSGDGEEDLEKERSLSMHSSVCVILSVV